MASTDVQKEVQDTAEAIRDAKEELKQREWDDFTRRLERSSTIRRIIGLPAVVIFFFLIVAVTAQRPEIDQFWGSVGAFVALTVSLIVQNWPAPRHRKLYDGPIGRKPAPF